MGANRNEATEETKLSQKCQQGLDGLNCEYVLDIEGADNLYLPKEVKKNDFESTIVEIGCTGGKLTAYVNPVHCIRPNNIKPLGIVDAIRLELIYSEVVEFIQEYLKKYLGDKHSEEYIQKLKVTRLECNLTLPCQAGARPTDIINLFDRVYDKTVLHRRFRKKYEKVNESFYYVRPKMYAIKVYSKESEQKAIGNFNVEDNLLRIEVVFLQRSIVRMYGEEKRTLGDVLTKQAVVTLCQEYKRVFEDEIISRGIKPFLNKCVEKLLESLRDPENKQPVAETIAKCREYIPDIEVLRRALKRWYREKEIEDGSRQTIRHYRNRNFNIPEGVIQTIKAFRNATE